MRYGRAFADSMKIALKVIALAVAAYVVLCCFLFAMMAQPPGRFAGVMKHVPWPAMVILPFRPLWNVARSGPARVGEMAPDFDLESTDHLDQFRLSSLRGQKPAVLVFGSYT